MTSPSPAAVEQAALAVWDYHRLGHALAPADILFVLGSHDLRVAERAAELYHQGLAPQVILSGGFGRMTARLWTESEAERYAAVLRERQVPEHALLLESRSTNTGENVDFTRALLQERGISVHSLIAVHKPYMERRTYAFLRRRWPEVEARIASPQLSFDAYCAGALSRASVIAAMVGDLQRIIEYPKRGFAIPQEVPPKVLEAFHLLIAAGYTSQMIPI